jgi:DNA sulfur modification protein DndB
MRVSFPAMQGLMGQRTYYACLMKLATIPKMFTFRDWAEFTPEQREQRVLNKKRVPDIAKYILDNEDGYLFSSITASYKCAVKFRPSTEGSSIGELDMEFEDANFVINDGQHRCAAIAGAIKQNPALSEEAISVLLFPYENLPRVQQMFSDLNRFVTKTSKSLDILYDKRDAGARVALEVVERVPVFNGMVDMDSVTLPVRSKKLFTLSSIYDATEELLGSAEDLHHNEGAAKAIEFWNAVAQVIPDWGKVKSDPSPHAALELRQEKICAHSVVLRALGAVGHDLMESYPKAWKERLTDLTLVDWRKVNHDWENVCIIANSVVSNRQARLATKAYLKRKLAMDLNEAEQRALTPLPLVAVQ